MKPVKLEKSSVAIAVSLFFFVALLISWGIDKQRHFAIPQSTSQTSQEVQPIFHEQFISFDETPVVHASSLTQRSDGKLMAVWFAGSEEGARDVTISGTIIDPYSHTVSPPRIISTPTQTEADTWRYIRKLGNPVIHQLPDGRLMLVYVSVSFGGWAASSLNIRFSSDLGKTWTPAKKLVTSPSLNISTLVKGVPIQFQNGDIGLPVYHEFFGKFGELLILDTAGNVRDKRRISWGREAIQPVLAPLDENRAIALLRDSGEQDKRIQFTQTADAGGSWQPLKALSLANPNAAVAVTALNDQEMLVVFNNHEEERYDLSMAYSADSGENWRVIHRFEYEPVASEGVKNKFSYPYIIRNRQGDFHLLYTWRKQRIKYIHFNKTWLDRKL